MGAELHDMLRRFSLSELAGLPDLQCRVCGAYVRFGSEAFSGFTVAKADVSAAFLDLCNPLSVGVQDDRWLVDGHRRCIDRVRPAWPLVLRASDAASRETRMG